MAKNVNILLKLQDQFTGPMKKAAKISAEQSRAMYKVNSGVFNFSKTVRTGFTSAVGHVATFGAALAGISGVLSVGAMKTFAADSMELAKAQVEAETKLEAVLGNVKSIASGGNEAILAAKEQLMGVASDIQKVGVIGDEVTLAGMQQLATFQLSADQISTLSKGMTDLLAQQKGLNASQGDAVSIANLIGKAMMGNVGALTKVGITLDDNQKKLIENGDATQRAAVLAEVLQQNVGGVNEALAQTDQGKIQQAANAWGDAKEEIGKHLLTLKANLAGVFVDYIPKIQEIGIRAAEKLSQTVTKAVGWFQAHSEEIKAALTSIRDKAVAIWGYIKPVLEFAIKHANTLIPAVLGVAGAISAVSVVSDVANKVHKGIDAFNGLRKTVKDAGGVLSWLKTGPLGLIILGIAAAVAAIVYLWTHCEKFRNAVKKIAAWFMETFKVLRDFFTEVKDRLVNAVTAIKDGFVNAFGKIKEKVGPVIDWIKEKIEAVKKFIEGLKQAWRDVTSGPWVDNSGGGAGADLHGHALGTPYFAGGLTRINEGGRGEIVDLPSGTRIIPHDVAKQAVSGGPVINVNLTVSGNVIGNRAFMEQTGQYIAERVLTALATT